jgi:hypothetical protein
MKNGTVTKAKRLIAMMGTEEIREIQEYASERWKVVQRRKCEAQDQAQWDKLAGLPIGSEVAVNAYGDRQFSTRHGAASRFTQHKGTEAHLPENGRRETLQLRSERRGAFRHKVGRRMRYKCTVGKGHSASVIRGKEPCASR